MKKIFGLLFLSIILSSCGSENQKKVSEEILTENDIIIGDEDYYKIDGTGSSTTTGEIVSGNIKTEEKEIEKINHDKSEKEISTEIYNSNDKETMKSIEILNKFYRNFNAKSFDIIFEILDSTFITDNTLKTYFSENRMKKFIDKVGNIEIYDIKEIEKERKENDFIIRRVLTYKLRYKLFGEEKQEDWKIYIIKYKNSGEYLINSISCETEKCGSMPFFNFPKYGI